MDWLRQSKAHVQSDVVPVQADMLHLYAHYTTAHHPAGYVLIWLVGYYLMGPATSLAGGRSTWSAEASAEVLVAGRLRSRVGGCGKCF